MKIYVVTNSYYDIVGVTTNRDIAENEKERYNHCSYGDDVASVDEYEDMVNREKSVWRVGFEEDGIVREAREIYDEELKIRDMGNDIIYVTIEADNKEEAIKIATKKRHDYLLEKIKSWGISL